MQCHISMCKKSRCCSTRVNIIRCADLGEIVSLKRLALWRISKIMLSFLIPLSKHTVNANRWDAVFIGNVAKVISSVVRWNEFNFSLHFSLANGVELISFSVKTYAYIRQEYKCCAVRSIAMSASANGTAPPCCDSSTLQVTIRLSP